MLGAGGDTGKWGMLVIILSYRITTDDIDGGGAIIFIHRMVEEEVEEGDRVKLWEERRLLEEEEEKKKEARMDEKWTGTNNRERKKQTMDPSKAREVPSLVEKLAKVAAIAPPSSPSSECRTPPTPPTPSCIGHTGLLGPRRKTPRKLVMMILFAFEVCYSHLFGKHSNLI